MTTTTLETLVGREGLLETAEGLRVRVRVLAEKLTWGRARLQVTPASGEGTAWVYRARVALDPPK